MRWWLGFAFAAIAGFTAVAVVAVFGARAEDAARSHAREFALGNALAASELLKASGETSRLRQDAAAIAARRAISLFVFSRDGRLLTPSRSEAISWSSVPGREEALRVPLLSGRYVAEVAGGSAHVIGLRLYGGNGRVLVAYSRRPELQEQLAVIRIESFQSALVAFAAGAALGFLVATLIARRVDKLVRAARRIGAGDFSEPVVFGSGRRFPDEVGMLAISIEQMRGQLQDLFQRLEHDRDRLESLLDRLNEGVVLVNGSLEIEFANGRARELLGDAERLHESALLGQEGVRTLRAFTLRLFRTRRPGSAQLETAGRTLAVSGIPPAAEGENAIVVLEDESERERNERVQREFATNAAHELRTPVASIVTAVEMLQTGAKEDPEGRDAFLRVIERESDRLTRLTRALLVLARAESRQEQPQLTPVRVAPLLEQVASALPHREGVEIDVRCAPSLVVASDPDLLEQAVSSVAINAVRYTGAGSVEMRGRRANGSVVIEVADTGQGIPERERERIFDRFYRVGDDADGFGLGLAIAREAIRTLGGELELESRTAVGTTARMTFKRRQGGADEPTHPRG
jgi:two-component system sensor histidine kinase VicK